MVAKQLDALEGRATSGPRASAPSNLEQQTPAGTKELKGSGGLTSGGGALVQLAKWHQSHRTHRKAPKLVKHRASIQTCLVAGGALASMHSCHQYELPLFTAASS